MIWIFIVFSIVLAWNWNKIIIYKKENAKLYKDNIISQSRFKSLALDYPFVRMGINEEFEFPDSLKGKLIYRYYSNSCGRCVSNCLHFSKNKVLNSLVVFVDSSKNRNEKIRIKNALIDFTYIEVSDSVLCSKVRNEKLEYFAYIDGNGKLCHLFYPKIVNDDIINEYLDLISEKFMKKTRNEKR